jgi:restriction system protein
MSQNQIKQLLEGSFPNLPIIKENKKYWFFRTEGGIFHDDFFTNNFIAIGYNNIPLKVIKEAKDSNTSHELETYIKDKYITLKKYKLAAHQLLRFSYEMTKGDIVIIPTYNSNQLSIGIVDSNEVVLSEKQSINVKHPTNYIKRRKIKWIKTINRDAVDAALYKVPYSHHVLTDVTKYGEKIDRNLYDFYQKGTDAHLVIRIKTEKKVGLGELIELFQDIQNLYSEFNKATGENDDPIQIQLQIESPGFLKINSSSKKGIIFLALVVSLTSCSKDNTSLLNQEVEKKFPMMKKDLSSLRKKADSLDVSGSEEMEKIINEN